MSLGDCRLRPGRLGHLVDVLVEGEVMSAGTHTATWTGRDSHGRAMPSGTYFFRLEADGFVDTRRMTLIPSSRLNDSRPCARTRHRIARVVVAAVAGGRLAAGQRSCGARFLVEAGSLFFFLPDLLSRRGIN